eukprot:scaffold143894_cov27-Tisochrysis_lutea.AAC.4
MSTQAGYVPGCTSERSRGRLVVDNRIFLVPTALQPATCQNGRLRRRERGACEHRGPMQRIWRTSI